MPAQAWAQASGAGNAPGVTSTTQLPRTGNPDADTTNSSLPVLVLGGGALLAGLAFWKRAQRQRDVRKRQ